MGNKDTKGDQHLAPRSAKRRSDPLTKGKQDQNAFCSPDSKSFLYMQHRQSGKKLLMQMPVTGGDAKQMSDKVAEFGTFSPDGKQIAAFTEEGTGVNIKVDDCNSPRRRAGCR